MRFEVTTAAENSDILGYLQGQQFKISQHAGETLYLHLQGFIYICYDTYYLACPTGRNHIVRIDNSTFERVEEFKYLGKTLPNQNSIPEEIKSRLR